MYETKVISLKEYSSGKGTTHLQNTELNTMSCTFASQFGGVAGGVFRVPGEGQQAVDALEDHASWAGPQWQNRVSECHVPQGFRTNRLYHRH